uniref:Uncharacterized protein n=1 Tax=Cyanothece sp. (strain PCC 7425 / ATCC 29141) TaxID=395961 RepID=B8HWE9_CYAP4
MRRSADSLLPPKVESAIRDLYAAFSHVERPVEVDACPCCISLEELEAIQTKPLGELTTDDLYNYSHNALLNVGNEEDFRYFLPRILEILAQYPEWWG